ncbi:MAG: TolC family protein [Bacteroidia bacterium]|nr:TolC family protein [Bacteroidia bacterium]
MKLPVLLFICWIPLGLHAQTTLSLEECIEYTLANHPSLGIFQNNVKIADAKSMQAVSAYLPQINGSVAFQDNLILATTIIPAGVFGPNEARVQFGNQYTTNALVDLSQAIYDQSKLNGIKATKPYAELTKLEQEQHREVLIYQTSAAFFQVLTLQQQLSDLSRTLGTYQDLLAIIKVQVEKGVVDFRERDRILINLKSVEYNIAEAKARLEVSKITLKNAMGMDLGEPLELDSQGKYEALVNLPETRTFDRSQLYDYRIGAANLALQEINVSTYRSAYLPTLSANARVGSQAFSNEFSTAFSTWNNFSYIGLTVNVPIFSGLRRSSLLKEQTFTLANAKINLDLTERNLELKAESAYSDLLTAYNKVQSQASNVELAQSVLESTTVQYEKGTASSTEFLNDDNSFQTAQNQYLSSIYAFLIARLNYENATGNLSNFYQSFNQE